MIRTALAVSISILLLAGIQSARAQTNYETWPELINPFESTGGGGVMIDDYRPVVGNSLCKTDFSVREPNGPKSFSEVVFDAVPVQGGILCTKGRWRTKDGSAEGTTPFEMFIKDGIVRRVPPGK